MIVFYKQLKCYLLLPVIVLFIFVTSCEKNEEEHESIFETSTVTDVEGNTYKTIKIGNQWWMAENLRVTKFRNGIDLVKRQDATLWNDTIAAYCLFQEINTAPGYLYNWHAVNDVNNLAPEGWRVSTDEDWKILEKYLGMTESEANKFSWRGNDQGNKLKIEGTKEWREFEDNWPTNESGFTARSGGCRLFNGLWAEPGLSYTGFWWTSSQSGDEKAYFRHLDYKESGVFRQAEFKTYGMSVRCIKN